jgi:hypothetical protein
MISHSYLYCTVVVDPPGVERTMKESSPPIPTNTTSRVDPSGTFSSTMPAAEASNESTTAAANKPTADIITSSVTTAAMAPTTASYGVGSSLPDRSFKQLHEIERAERKESAQKDEDIRRREARQQLVDAKRAKRAAMKKVSAAANSTSDAQSAKAEAVRNYAMNVLAASDEEGKFIGPLELSPVDKAYLDLMELKKGHDDVYGEGAWDKL